MEQGFPIKMMIYTISPIIPSPFNRSLNRFQFFQPFGFSIQDKNVLKIKNKKTCAKTIGIDLCIRQIVLASIPFLFHPGSIVP